jgi:hypothetical protein
LTYKESREQKLLKKIIEMERMNLGCSSLINKLRARKIDEG